MQKEQDTVRDKPPAIQDTPTFSNYNIVRLAKGSNCCESEITMNPRVVDLDTCRFAASLVL